MSSEAHPAATAVANAPVVVELVTANSALADIGLCDNCGTVRRGQWCHVCGQHVDTAHHSVRRLFVEAVEHLANTDGKVFRTMRGLFLHPGSLTRDYLAGKRAAQLPPLQLFFVALVLFLIVGENEVRVEFITPTPQQVAAMPSLIRWTMPISDRIHAHGGDFLELMRQSAEIFGFLTVPVAGLLLWGLFAGRRFRLYDHLIFALHSLAFQMVMWGVLLLLPDDLFEVLGLPVILAMAVHLILHLRGVYGGGIVATLARIATLGLGLLIAFSALSVAWIATAYMALVL